MTTETVVAVDPKGPTVTQVSAALTYRGFAKSRTRGGGLPSFGFTARKSRGDAYVVVTATGGCVSRHAEALRSAGYVVETLGSEVHVFKRARTTSRAGQVTMPDLLAEIRKERAAACTWLPVASGPERGASDEGR